MTPRRLLGFLSILATALALGACGTKDDNAGRVPAAQKLSLVLDYFPNADHAGIYAAQARGDFRRAGLDVTITPPSDPALPLKLVSAGKADLAISYEPELLLARDKGARLVAVAALAQRPLTSVIALSGAKVKKVSDLAGKTVGTAGIPYQSAYLKTILTHEGVDPASVKEVNVGFDLVRAMKTKRVDATLGAFWNYEGVQLTRSEKDKPTIIRVDEVGVPSYDELVLVGKETYLRDHGALVRRFVQALQEGTRALRADPAVGIDPLLKVNTDLKRTQEEQALRRRSRSCSPPTRPSRSGGWNPSSGRRTRPGCSRTSSSGGCPTTQR